MTSGKGSRSSRGRSRAGRSGRAERAVAAAPGDVVPGPGVAADEHGHAPDVRRVGRPRGPRRSRDERREELLDAAQRAIQRVGPQASMDELAAEAGITKPILYSHFGDKAGLANALAGRVATELDRAISASLGQVRHPQQVVSSTIDAFCSFIEAETPLYRFLVQTAMTQADRQSRSKLIADFANQISVVLGGALRQAGADSGAAEPWAFAIVGMTLAGGEWWLERRTMSREDLVAYLTQLLWTGLSGAGLDRLGELIEEGARGEADDVGNVAHLPDRAAPGDR